MYEDCGISIAVIKKNAIMFYKNQYLKTEPDRTVEPVRQYFVEEAESGSV